ncbi:molybdenum cofactor guanylyltransferase [Ornithinimicrobium cavernae]|uniref:molybdenum cofactor guanylyltransferase n=1 Tax=Ornithinimicrobium cavernae TaxID=2666047 RepID=UPI000D6969D3|nr:NTP transferase domain-containing protein [Ornithinimicrobium cavernae]
MIGQTAAPSTVPEHDLLVLAGGAGSRLGGVDKAGLVVGGRRLLDRALDATKGARLVVVVGPVVVPEGVLQTVEDPPGGGPVAGIVAGMRVLTRAPETGRGPGTGGPAPWTVLLAVDQPEAALAVPGLLSAAATVGPDVDLVCPVDGSGHPQWLLAAYRTPALTAALRDVGTGHGTSVRHLVSGLRSVAAGPSTHVGDIDTWEDHATWQAHVREREGL